MSFDSSTICVLCSNKPGTASCDGCRRKFCLPCLNEHRNELSLELDDLFNRRNELVETINNCVPNNTTGTYPCLDEINRWQTEMHANIDRIASLARDNVRQLMSEASKSVRSELDEISRDLQQKQKSGGYLEGDLDRIKQQLVKLNQTVQQLSEQIHIDTSASKDFDWDSLLFVTSNRHNPVNSRITTVPPSSNLYSSSHRKSTNRMSMPYQQYSPNTLPSTSIPHSSHTQSFTGRSASLSMGSRPSTYTCIGCKTTNILQDNGRNFCSVCRCAAPF